MLGKLLHSIAGLKAVGVSFFLAYLLVASFRCGDSKKIAMYVCNKKRTSIIVYGFYMCEKLSGTSLTTKINKVAVHVIEPDKCVYFTDRAWECQLSWWDYWLEDVGCEDFSLVYFITEYRRYNIDMWDIGNVRKVAIDSIVLTRDSIEKKLPDCELTIN